MKTDTAGCERPLEQVLGRGKEKGTGGLAAGVGWGVRRESSGVDGVF